MNIWQKVLAEKLLSNGLIEFGNFKNLVMHDGKPNAPPSPIRIHLKTPDNPTNPGLLTQELISEITGFLR